MTTTRSVRRRLLAGLLAVALCTVSVAAQKYGALQADPGGVASSFHDILGADDIPDLVVSPGRGPGLSHVLDGATLNDLGAGFPFGAAFSGGVRMALGDLTGDGVDDIVTAMGPGGSLVKVLNGMDASEVGSGFPFGAGFGGGVNVAVGDFNGDGRLDVVTAQATGGGALSVFDGVNYAPLFSLRPFGGSYASGMNVATGDINADGISDIVVGQANGGLVSVIDGAARAVVVSGVPFGGGGVFVAAGDVNGDGRADVMAAPDSGPGPVLVYDVNALAPITTFMPYGAGYTGGVRLAASDLNGDGRVEIITVPGPGGQPVLKVFDGATFANTSSVLVYPDGFSGGIFVAAPSSSKIKFTSAESATFTVGTAGTFSVRVSGSGSPTITRTGALPAGVTFTSNSNGTATLAGTPAAGTGGTYPLTFTATSGSGAPAVQSFTLTVNQAPAVTSAASTTFGLGIASTFTVTSTGFPRPTVSAVGTLPAGITFTPNSSGGGTLAGTAAPGTAGTYPLTISASNGVGTAATQNFVLTITSSPSFTSAASATFVVGTAATFSVTTSAVPAVTSITRTGTLPSGISFSDNGNGTATLSGTAAAGTAGAYPLTFAASNGTASAQQSFTLTVQASSQAPAITSANATVFTVGASGSFSVTATGSPTPTLVLTGALPSGVTFTNNGNGTATLAGTPAAGTGGSYALSFNASNGVGSPAVQAFTLTVNQAPAITSANATTFAIGTSNSFSVTTTGSPSATVSVTGVLPAGVTFTNNGNGTGTLAGTPAAGTGGTYPLSISANNGVGTAATQNFVLTVTSGPAFTSAASATFVVGTAATFNITTSAVPAVTSITRTGTLPTGITFTDNANGTATLSGTAAAGTAGAYPLTLTASNGTTSVQQAFTLTVNQAPAITSANATTFTVGATGSFSVTTTGSPAATLSLTGALPSGVTFTNNGNGTGTLAGTPAAGTGGSYTLSINASNGVGSAAVQTFTLTVNQAPAITSAATTTFTVGTSGSFSVTTTGSPSATVSVTGALPSGVTFTNNGNGTGTLAGTPAAGTGGSYPLTISANNGVGTAATQSFVLSVTSGPAFTSAASATFVAGTPATFSVTTSGVPAVTSITRTGTLPTGITFTDNANGTATLSGTAAVGTAGVYPLTLTASNGTTSVQQAFTLTVNQAPAITSANATTFTVGANGSFSVTTTGSPAATLSLTGALPSGVTFINNGNGTGTLAGTPAAGTGGSYALSLNASNGVGSAAVQAFTLTVNQAPAITSANATTFTTNVAGSFVITTTGVPVPTVTVTGTLPAGVTFTPSAGGGTLSGTTTATPGAFVVTIGASNGVGSPAAQSFTLTVSGGGGGGPVGNADSYSNGVGNTQYSVGAGTPATPAVVIAGTVLSNDTGVAPLSAGPASIATTNGGQVAMSTNGAFLYTPAAGFAGPSDTFTYTVTDGNGGTGTAVVTINLTGVVWYVNAGAGGGGTGRSNSPFNTMTAAAAAAQANQIIYVHAGSPAGATVLKASQTLWGAGAAFTLNGLTIPATSAPTLQGTVTLADGVLVNSLSVNGGGSAAIAATGTTATETLNAVSITGGSSGLNLTNLAGTFSMVGGSITGVTAGADVLMSGGTGTVTIGASVVNTGGRSIDIQNRTAGTVTFSGAISDTGTGILLNANAGSTIAFTGGVALSTGVNAAFTATNGGTVTATQNNTSIVNTVLTTDGEALRVQNTEIGSAGLTFRSIAAGTFNPSAGVALVLENTGVGAGHGGLTVTGTGTTQSGGRIRRKTGADANPTTEGIAMYLSNTKNPSFNWVELVDFTNSAIVARNVAGFLFADSGISGAGSTGGEGAIVFGEPGGANGLQTGTAATIRNAIIAGGYQHNVAFYGQSGTMTLLIERTSPTVGACEIGNNSTSTGGDGVMVQLDGTAVGTVTIQQCRLRNNRLAGFRGLVGGTATLTAVVNGAEIVRSAQGTDGVVLSNASDADLTASITNNTISNFPGAGVLVGQVSGDASALSELRATITGNSIESPATGGSATGVLGRLSSTPGQVSQTRLLIANNGVPAQAGVTQFGLTPAVVILTPDPGTTPNVDVTISGNHIDMNQSPLGSGIYGPWGMEVQATQGSLCANIVDNISHGYQPVTNDGGIRIGQSGTATFTLAPGTQASGTPALTVLQANNPYPSPFMSYAALGSITTAGSCQLP